MMRAEIVKAGHRYYGLAYLILGEDGADPANDDPDLPNYVFRLTMATGRQLDLTNGPADEMRRTLAERGGAMPEPTQGHYVPSPASPARRPVRRRGRKAE